jgi:hypothetical protein
MTVSTRFLMLVLGIVVVAAMIMAPRRDEWLAMMLDADRQAEVISLLSPQLARGEYDPSLLATLGRAYAETGEYQRAAELLERYTALRPDDAEGYARLADLYKRTYDVNRRIAMLERHIAITPTPSRAMELAILYHQEHRADEEFALLSRFEHQLTVQSGLVLRLAELVANNGDRERAIRILMRSEEGSARPRHNESERIFWAELLIESGHSAEAVDLGKQWILEWREPFLAGRLLRSFTQHAPVADASELGEAVASLHPEVRFFFAVELAKMGAVPVARHLLETWSKANLSPSMNEIAAFLSTCRDLGEQTVVWQAFGEVLRRRSSEDLILRFSAAIAAEFGIGALAPFWPNLPNVIERRPLLAAQLAFHEHNLAMTKWLLEKVDPATSETSDRQMWIDLLNAVASPPEVFQVLRDRRRSGHLPPDLLPSMRAWPEASARK